MPGILGIIFNYNIFMKEAGVKNKIVLFILVSAFFSGILGCDKIKQMTAPKSEAKVVAQGPAIQPRGPIVAKINNIAIGLDDLNDEIEFYNANVPEESPELKITTREQKINYLKNEVIRRTLIYQQALDKGLDRNDEVRQAVEKNKREMMVMQNVQDIVKNITASSKEVEDYYNTYKDQLKEPEERKVSEIVVGSEQEAKDLLVQLLQGANFTTLAKANSKAPSAADGGVIDFVAKGVKSEQFDEVVFASTLDIGELSSIFKTPEGYSIIRLDAKRGGKLKPLSEMWDDINRGLVYMKQQQAIEELVGKLSRDAKIEVSEGEIK